MSKELTDLVIAKKIFVYVMNNGTRYIGEKFVGGDGYDEMFPDRKSITVLNALEISWDVDFDLQSDYIMIPIAPANHNQLTAVFTDQIAAISHASDALKLKYWKVVTSEQLMDAIFPGGGRKSPKKKSSTKSSEPALIGANEDDYSITRIDDITTLDVKEIEDREPLDFDSTAPSEVGLEDVSEEDLVLWKGIMKNFPYRDWKTG